MSADAVTSRVIPLLALAALLVCGQGASARETESPAGVRPPAGAQVGEQGGLDQAELNRYPLTMQKVRKWADANRRLAQVAREHPELEREQDDEEGIESLDELEAFYKKIPQARSAIEASGLGTREYLVLSFVLIQAHTALAVAEEMGADPNAFAAQAAESGMNPAHIAFVREHKAELEPMFAELQKMQEEDEEEEEQP
jgi:hypothetical protein